jgi:cytochrome oxidase Cu insertion factor (SCO1/SenC/PrrC family)
MQTPFSGVRRRVPTWALAFAIALILSACSSATVGSTASDASTPTTRPAAPDFTLEDQFGNPETLSAFKGQTVLLTFVDSHCTTVCPLTAQLMERAKHDLGADHPVQLLAVNVNLRFRTVADVLDWSSEHRMLHQWLFLTGSGAQLRKVWSDYGIDVKMVDGDVQHTALVYVVDPTGHVAAPFPIAQHGGIDAESVSLARFVEQVDANTS